MLLPLLETGRRGRRVIDGHGGRRRADGGRNHVSEVERLKRLKEVTLFAMGELCTLKSTPTNSSYTVS